MHKILCAVVAAGTMFAGASPAAAADLPADTVTYLRQAVAGGTYVGVIVGLVDDGQVTIQSFGVADKTSGKAPDADTVWEIGSITKTFTGTLLAGEVLGGKMTLDDPVQSYLPAGVTMPQVGARPMTLGDVATHASGLPRLPAGFAPKNPADPYADIDEAKLWDTVRTLKLTRAPGEASEYSNFGFGLLGAIVAREASKPYRELVAERVFKPLHMRLSDVGSNDAIRPHLAQGYDAAGMPVSHWTFQAVPGLGGIYSSANDMLAYLRANMAAAAGTGPATQLQKAMALALKPRAAMGKGRIGLAWISSPDVRSFAHDGGTYGFSSFIGFTADGKRGAVIFANTLAVETTSGIGAHLVDPTQPLPPLLTEVRLVPEILAQYAGRYSFSPELQMDVTESDGRITIALPGQPATPLFASAPDHFYLKVMPIRIDFERDQGGKVMRLVSHQSGQRYRAARLGDDGKPVAQPARIALNAAQLDTYVGRYQLAPEAVLTIAHDGDRLMAHTNTQPTPAPLFSERPDHFEFDLLDVDLDFQRDAGGKVIAANARIGAEQVRAPRLDP